MKKPGLNPKQSRFVQEYLIDFNGKQAAIRTGYSGKTAEVQGSRLLSNANVSAAISEAKKKTGDRLEITRDRWLLELSHSAFLDPKDLFEDDGSLKLIKDMPESARRAINGLEVTEIFDNAKDDQKSAIGLLKKIKLIPKNSSLELIGKHLGFLKEKFEGSLTVKAELSISDFKKSLSKIK